MKLPFECISQCNISYLRKVRMFFRQISSLIFSCIAFTSVGQIWVQLSDFPGTERDDGVCFTIGAKAYCGCGFDSGFNATGDFYAFDFSGEQWNAIGSLPDSANRQYAAAFVYNGDGYIFGGVDASGAFLNDLWKYNPISNSWNYLSSLPSMGRSGSVSFVIADTAYIVGGKNAISQALAEVWGYVIPTGTWIQKGDAATSIWRGVGFEDAGMGYIGLGADNLATLNPSFYRYYPETDLWELVPELVTIPRTYTAWAKMGDKVYLYGGESLSGYENSFERINMSSLTIDNLTDFSSAARRGATGFANGTDFYLVNGVTLSERLNETWVARDALSMSEINQNKALGFGLSDGVLCFYSDEMIRAIQIYSTNGRMAAEKGNDGSNVIDVSRLSQGIYYFEIFWGSGITRGRLYLP